MKKQSYKLAVFLVACMMFTVCGQTKTDNYTPDNANVSETEGRQQEVSYERISQEEAKQLMAEEEGYIILDVRTEEEYAQGHIPGAVCVPNETIGEDMPEELPEKEQLILVYCRSGNRSKQASEKLAELGYANVKEFGGITDWDGDIEQ